MASPMRKRTFEERLRRMTDTQLPELCISIRDALPSIKSKEDREEFVPMDLEQLLSYKRLSTAPHGLITHVHGTMSHYRLNKAGRRALEIIGDEVRRRSRRRE